VKFLISQYGFPKVVEAFQALKRDDDPKVVAENAERIAALFGASVTELERAWLDTIKQTKETAVPVEKIAEIKASVMKDAGS